MTGKIGEIFNMDDIPFERRKTPDGHNIDFIAKDTVIRFAKETKNEEQFVFYTEPGVGSAYIGRMRTELSRLRKKIIENKRKPAVFKVIEMGVEQFPTHDKVTLKRSLSSAAEMSQELKKILADLEEK